MSPGCREAFWSAPVLWRFQLPVRGHGHVCHRCTMAQRAGFACDVLKTPWSVRGPCLRHPFFTFVFLALLVGKSASVKSAQSVVKKSVFAPCQEYRACCP